MCQSFPQNGTESLTQTYNYPSAYFNKTRRSKCLELTSGPQRGILFFLIKIDAFWFFQANIHNTGWCLRLIFGNFSVFLFTSINLTAKHCKWPGAKSWHLLDTHTARTTAHQQNDKKQLTASSSFYCRQSTQQRGDSTRTSLMQTRFRDVPPWPDRSTLSGVDFNICVFIMRRNARQLLCFSE